MSTPMHLGELRRIKKHQLKETDRQTGQRGDRGACDISKTYRTKWPDRIPALSTEIPERGVVIVVSPVPVHPSHPVLQLFLHRLHRPVTDISEIDCRGRCAVLTERMLKCTHCVFSVVLDF
ncbi:hypothetical protein F2P79_000513 [Pimephales promelas]|nr:hypothetical protein F2P79_000513 [Pimephales promelas]